MSTVALVIDDNRNTAKSHRLVLEDLGLRVVTESSPEGAINRMRNLPSFDLVICDLSFDDGHGAPNTKGQSVGLWMKERDYPTVSYLCSARFAENDGEYRESLSYFDSGLSHLAEPDDYEDVVQRARANKISRLEESQLEVTPELALRNERSLQRVHRLVDETTENENREYFDEGFEVLAVQPVVHGFAIGSPVFLWKKDIPEGVYLEVYGQPTLLAFGDDLAASLTVMNEVLYRTYIDLHGELVRGPAKFVQKFLDSVYDDDFQELGALSD